MRALLARLTALAVIAVSGAVAGCSASSAWTSVALPGGATPVTLTSYGDRVLIGAQDPARSAGPGRPRLFLIGGGSPSEIPVEPLTPYAEEGTWLTIRRDGHGLIAVAGARGGAHANVRWTVWSGTERGLTELPQGFGTFGGWGAGDLLGVATATTGPLVVGTWASAQAGLDAAVWRRAGDRWVRQSSAGTALESTRTDLVGPVATDALGAHAVIVGSLLHLGAGRIDQRPALWVSRTATEGWRRIDLPSVGQGEAAAVTCAVSTCVIIGRTDGRLAVWSFDGTSATSTPTPDVAGDEKGTLPAPALDGDRVILALDGDQRVRLLVNDGGTWRETDGPAGQVRALATGGGAVWVLTVDLEARPTLWSGPEPRD